MSHSFRLYLDAHVYHPLSCVQVQLILTYRPDETVNDSSHSDGAATWGGEPVNYAEFKLLDASPKLFKRDEGQEVQRQADRVSVKSTSTKQLSWPQGMSGSALIPGFYKPESIIQQEKGRDSTGSGELPPQMGVDAQVSSPPLKVSRFERLDDKRSGRVEAGRDFNMQQRPQMSSILPSLQSSIVAKPDLQVAASSRRDNSGHFTLNNYAFGPGQMGLRDLQSAKVALSNVRENSGNVAMQPGRPPADEGSRTGFKGSSVGILLNINGPSANLVPGATHNTTSLGKSWSQSAGSESMYAASQQTTISTSRQLTIFYGGQAHVFDDVPSDKADAIVTLAGSSGRSWSTMYTPSPRSEDGVPGYKSKLAQSAADGERSTVINGKSSTLQNSDARSSEHEVLRNPVLRSPRKNSSNGSLPRDFMPAYFQGPGTLVGYKVKNLCAFA
ncbi:hypothetical protein GOP47_0008185 [Adiantum capillus-veneris]|uniref:Tify domain-containing protein n=1 Tax=Adiantum capillus-veneris TaxID=13818 RepID=A0A9D4ZKF3_ADICA|nr:hypothetical protein GOP47_0008185 [Adiantum capillus-veneris]